MTIPYDEAIAVPLETDALIEQRVADLIGRANRRQLWLLFLDDQQVQLPVIIPIDALPSAPPSGPDEAATLAEMLKATVDAAAAASVIIVVERFGPPALTPSDVAWARALHDACDAVAVPLRAILLSHRAGVRWVAQDDYLW